MKKKHSAWIKIGTIVLAACCALVAWLTTPMQTNVSVQAEAETIDVTTRLTMEDRDWAVSSNDHTALGILLDGEYLGAKSELRKYWNDNGETLKPLNNGCDLMEYIYINGVSARALVMENKTSKKYVGTTFPFSAGSWYAPVTVESASRGSGGLWIKVLTAFAGTEYEVTIKKGFTLIRDDGAVLTVSGDIQFQYSNGMIFQTVQAYTLSFAGTPSPMNPIGVTAGSALTALPNLPANPGYTGVWQIDGQTVDRTTIYSFGCDKTVVAVYTAIPYTITLMRANGTIETLAFTMDNAAETLLLVQLTPNDEDYAYSWEKALPDALEAKDYTFVEIATDVRPKSKIVSQSVTIGAQFSLNFFVTAVEGDEPTMQFTFAGETQTVAGTLVDEAARKYVYRLENIAACDLATDVEIALLSGEKTVDRMVYSVERYLNALAKQDISDALKAVIADVVAYAQAAEALAGKQDGLQTIDVGPTREYEEMYETDFRQSASKQAGVEMTAQYVAAADANRLAVRFLADSTEGLTLEVNGVAVDFAEVEEGCGIYAWESDALDLLACADRFKIVILQNGEVVQTTIYSVKSYVYEMQTSAWETVANYWKALYNCFQTLTAYAKGE